jgi:hypothetical protein
MLMNGCAATFLINMAATTRRPVRSLMAVGGAGAVVVGAALPWLALGRKRYSAFGAARAARSIRLFESLDLPAARWAVIVLLTTPVIVPFGSVLLTLGFRRVGALLLFLVGLLGVVAGALVVVSSSDRLVGPILALAGGIVACVASISLGFARNRSEASSTVRST